MFSIYIYIHTYTHGRIIDDYCWIIVGFTIRDLIGTIVAPVKGRVIVGTPVDALNCVCG